MGKQNVLVNNHEMFNRVNFLYQAAHTVLRENPTNIPLIRTYCWMLKSVARKNVMRLDPSIKRTLCRKCYMLLVPGVTAKIRISGKRQSHSVVSCLECHTVKRFVVSAEHSLWTEHPEAWIHPPRHLVAEHSNQETSNRDLEMKRGNTQGSSQGNEGSENVTDQENHKSNSQGIQKDQGTTRGHQQGSNQGENEVHMEVDKERGLQDISSNGKSGTVPSVTSNMVVCKMDSQRKESTPTPHTSGSQNSAIIDRHQASTSRQNSLVVPSNINGARSLTNTAAPRMARSKSLDSIDDKGMDQTVPTVAPSILFSALSQVKKKPKIDASTTSNGIEGTSGCRMDTIEEDTGQEADVEQTLSNELGDQMSKFLSRVSQGDKMVPVDKCHNCKMQEMQFRIPKKGFKTKNSKKGTGDCQCSEIQTPLLNENGKRENPDSS